MQRPNPDSIYYDEFIKEDMADYELSVRQYQRMEQDPTAIVSLWQLFKLAKAHDLDIHELLDL